jgi:hypothetical protein
MLENFIFVFVFSKYFKIIKLKKQKKKLCTFSIRAIPLKSTWEGGMPFFYFSVGCGGETIFFFLLGGGVS